MSPLSNAIPGVCKPTVLVLASTFPRWKEDAEPPFVYELSSRLAAGYNVTVLAPRSPGAAKQEVWEDGLRIVRYPYFIPRLELLAYQGGILAKLRTQPAYYLLIPFFLLGQLLAILRLCHSQRFDVIHAHWIFPQGFLAIVAQKMLRQSSRIVVTSHGGDLYGLRGSWLTKIKQWVLSQASSVTVVSQVMRRDLATLTNGKIDCAVVSMGVALRQHFTPSPSVVRNPWQLLFVGRLVEKKGLNVLLKALPLLRDKWPEIKLVIVGDGPERGRLESLACELGLVDMVTFVGRKSNDETIDYYRKAGVFVMPSIVAADGDQEGLGLVSIEAMGCGCPVVASDLAAIQDVVIDRVTGLLFSCGSSQSLAETLECLFVDRELAERLSIAARDYVLQHYDWTEVAKAYGSILQEVQNVSQDIFSA